MSHRSWVRAPQGVGCLCGFLRFRHLECQIWVSRSLGALPNCAAKTLRELSSGFSDTLAEWSKAVDSSSTIFGCVGSNPTGVTIERHERKVFTMTALLLHLRAQCLKMTAVGFEPTPLRTGALSQHLRPLGQTVLLAVPPPNSETNS